MRNLWLKLSLLYVFCALAALSLGQDLTAADKQWIRLFDGKGLTGWKASENEKTFSVEDGMIVADGPRSHLFYVGPVEDHDFANFELRADVMTMPRANSGIYFHTAYQQRGWPRKGYEVQINNTYRGGPGYRELKKTGSLYSVRNVFASCAKDNEWFAVHIVVQGRRIQVLIDGKPVVDYIEPDDPVRQRGGAAAKLSHGTFALQGHDPGSKVYFKNIHVKPLPGTRLPKDPRSPQQIALQKRITSYHAADMPLIDYHVHLKGGLTLQEALQKSRQVGITYGIAENCGLGFKVVDDEGLKRFLDKLEGMPAFKAMQVVAKMARKGKPWHS
jgi:hypothetical protein